MMSGLGVSFFRRVRWAKRRCAFSAEEWQALLSFAALGGGTSGATGGVSERLRGGVGDSFEKHARNGILTRSSKES